MAKIAARKGYRVLFVGTEQPVEMLVPVFGGMDIDFVRKEEGVLLKDCIGDDEYDILIYDYLGAESGAGGSVAEWQVYRDQANYLSNLAIEKNICVLTAGQADIKITTIKPEEVPNSGYYVSSSKHIIDKISGGVYLLKNETGSYLVMIKNRYGMVETGAHKIKIDYKNKEVNNNECKSFKKAS